MPSALLTFGESLDIFANRSPDEIVLSCARENGTIDRVSRGQLRLWSDRLANALISAGVQQGVLVPILLPTSNEFLVATTAIYKAGGTPMPMSYRLPPAERDALLALADAPVVISNQPLAQITLSVDDFKDGEAVTPPDRRVSNPIKALASGGSTGKSKLIITQGPFEVPLHGHPVAPVLRFHPGDLKYSPGPLYHNGPFWFSVMMLLQGGRILLNERFNAARCLALCASERPAVLNLVPTMMQRMLRESTWAEADLSSVDTVWHLAAPCPPWAKEGFIDKLGGDRVLELWAATESTGLTILDGNEWLTHRGSVGKPIATEIRILDDQRNELPPGEVGEIFSRFGGQAAQYQYLGSSPLETTDDGFASVGDLGWLDADGYLYLADRRTDLIISGGANIFPAEIEAVISQHPDVVDVAVVGLKDPDLGRRVHAVIEVKDPAAPPEIGAITALCESQLVRYKVPRGIEFVGQLPRNDAGKIRRIALREARETSSN